MLVKAIDYGFIYGQVKKPGDKFELVDLETKKGIYRAEDQFSENWMERLEEPEKLRKTRKPKNTKGVENTEGA